MKMQRTRKALAAVVTAAVLVGVATAPAVASDPIDLDGDGVPDINLVDSDGDGKNDEAHSADGNVVRVDTDGDGRYNDEREIDANGDGLFDRLEIYDKNGKIVKIYSATGDGEFYEEVTVFTPKSDSVTVHTDNDGDGEFDTSRQELALSALWKGASVSVWNGK